MSSIKLKNEWLEFYNNIKDESWPECMNEHEFYDLPSFIQEEIIEIHDGEKYIFLSDDDITEHPYISSFVHNEEQVELPEKYKIAKDFEVYFNDDIYGGGIPEATVFPKLLKALYPLRKFEHGMEWCAGAGFIGFRLLSDSICQTMDFVEKYEPALQSVKETWKNAPMRLHNAKVNCILSSKIANIGDKKYDLIVANPPNFDNGVENRIVEDSDAMMHKEFFLNIRKNLANDGVIILSKMIDGHQPKDFVDAVDQGGLKINRIFRVSIRPRRYYVEVQHK